jgi:hypothetical protein
MLEVASLAAIRGAAAPILWYRTLAKRAGPALPRFALGLAFKPLIVFPPAELTAKDFIRPSVVGYRLAAKLALPPTEILKTHGSSP